MQGQCISPIQGIVVKSSMVSYIQAHPLYKVSLFSIAICMDVEDEDGDRQLSYYTLPYYN